MSRGHLKLATDDVGTIYVQWDKIVSVTTALEYEVGTTSGTRYVGVLAPASGSQLRVIAKSGTAMTVAFLDVVSFAPIKASPTSCRPPRGNRDLPRSRSSHSARAICTSVTTAWYSASTSLFRHDYPRTAVDLSILMFHEFNRLGRLIYDTFDTQPQVSGVSRNDVGVSFSISRIF